MRRRGALRSAAQMRPHPRQQFLNAEWLGHVVVGAGVQRLHLRPLVLADRKNQHRRGAAGADGAADLHAAHARHHQVGNHQVRRPIAEELQAFFGIVGGAHVVALRGERGAQHPRNLRFVVDNQNSARHSLSSFSRKITSFATGAGMIPVEKIDGECSPIRGQASFTGWWPRPRRLRPRFCWSGCAPTRPPRAWCFWCWWCGRRPRPGSRSRSTSRLSARSPSTISSCFPFTRFGWRARRQWVAMLSFVASCLVVGRVAERARRQARQAEQRQADVERLYALSQEMMLYEDADGLIRDLPAPDRPHLRARRRGSVRLRPGPVLCLDRRDCPPAFRPACRP